MFLSPYNAGANHSLRLLLNDTKMKLVEREEELNNEKNKENYFWTIFGYLMSKIGFNLEKNGFNSVLNRFVNSFLHK